MTTFESLGLNTSLLRAVTEIGYVNPTPVQEKVIPALLNSNQDMVALAQTGTGKTAAFGLPLLHMLNFQSRETQALILCPTRELCMQITKDLQGYAEYLKGANIVSVYGGASIQNQIEEIKRGAQIIVATPGRMIDIIGRKRVNLNTVKFVVLDEADEMLNMGFKEDLDEILSETPAEKNTWLFSATMPDEVQRISRNYMNAPVEITLGSKNQGNENIEHIYYVVHPRDKYPALKRIADFNPDIFAIVFCRTKRETQQVADALIKDGYNADALHGDLSQSQRDHVMKRYRSRSLQMLVATDVAARGIDVDDVTHVINYNLPDELENYTHRSGRTARAGKTGVSILLISSREVDKIRVVERIIKKKFTRATIPNGFEVCEKQLFSLIKKIHNVEVNEEGIRQYLPKIYEELNELSKEEIIKRFVSTEFNRFLEYYKTAPDLNAGGQGERSHNPNVQKLFISLGELDKLDKKTLVDYVCDTAGIPKSAVTWVNVKNSFSFVEVSSESLPAVLAAFKDKMYRNRPVRVEARDNSYSSQGGGDRSRNKYSRFSKDVKEGGKPNFRKESRESGPSGYREKKERNYDNVFSFDNDKKSDTQRSERNSYSRNEKPSFNRLDRGDRQPFQRSEKPFERKGGADRIRRKRK